MDKEQNDTTHDTGAPLEKEEGLQGQGQEEAMTDNAQGKSATKTVPYERFQKVNEQKKQAESALEAACTTLAEQMPENFQALIPKTLPIGERLEWIHNALKSGIFSSKAPTDSPDPARPTKKPDFDMNTATPHSLMARGYK